MVASSHVVSATQKSGKGVVEPVHGDDVAVHSPSPRTCADATHDRRGVPMWSYMRRTSRYVRGLYSGLANEAVSDQKIFIDLGTPSPGTIDDNNDERPIINRVGTL